MGDTTTDSYSEWATTEDWYNYVSSVSEQGRYSMHVVSLVLFSITFVLGIPGNAFVIWVAGVKMKKTVTTTWYVNLAVADLVCCLYIPLLMAEIVLDGPWPYGAAMCKVLPSIVILNMFASVFTLTLISLDRFTLVVWPVWAQNHRTVSRAWMLCGLAWLLSLLLSMPDLIFREIDEFDNITYCFYVDNQSVTRAIFVSKAMFGFLVPLLVITVCSLLIFRRLSAGRFKSQKALRIMVGVVTVFFVCWMPYHTVVLVIGYGGDSSVDVALAAYSLVISLVFINSCLNPVLYMFMGRDFKERARVSLLRIFENAFSEDATGAPASPKGQMSRVANSSESQV